MPKFAKSVHLRRPSFDRILVDMNTQCDLLLPQGTMPVINRFEVLVNIRKIMKWALAHSLPVISSLECHRIEEFSRGLPPYCIDRSAGQRKVPITLLPSRIVVRNDSAHNVSLDPFRRCQQIILIKRSPDFLSNPKVDRLFQVLSAKHIVFFGVGAELWIKAAVLSLIGRQQLVMVVTDACGAWCGAAADLAMRQMGAKGAVLVTTEELISGVVDERFRSPVLAFVPDKKEDDLQAGHRYAEPFCWP